MTTIGNISALDNVGLLVRLNSANSTTQTPEYVGKLVDEAKQRGLLVSISVSPNTPIGREEFRLSSLPYEDLGKILVLVTRADHTNYMGLHEEVLKEREERTPSKAKPGDMLYFSNEKRARITIDNGVAFYGKGHNDLVQISDLEPSPKHGRGCWILKDKG
jgi:hypothetical protein